MAQHDGTGERMNGRTDGLEKIPRTLREASREYREKKREGGEEEESRDVPLPRGELATLQTLRAVDSLRSTLRLVTLFFTFTLSLSLSLLHLFLPPCFALCA